MEVKQYIIIRTDLGMSIGKTAAQASHASMKVFFDKMETCVYDDKVKSFSFLASEEESKWIEGRFTKIVKKVKNESQLLKVYQQALDAGLNVSLIKDAGLTELVGENYTAVAIGPNYVNKCEEIVKKLQNL